MSVTVRFPALLGERIGGVESVELAGDTAGAVLRALTDRYVELAPLVWKPTPELNPVMVVFLNGRQLGPGELTVPVADGDEIMVLSALEGGSDEPMAGTLFCGDRGHPASKPRQLPCIRRHVVAQDVDAAVVA